MDLVTDTSTVIACILNEPSRDALLVATSDRRLIAPESLPWEIANAFSAMFKRRRIALNEAINAWRLFGQVSLELRPIDMEAAIGLASRLGIYAYDAHILQCAVQSGADLLTLDRGLMTAAKLAGVSLCEVP